MRKLHADDVKSWLHVIWDALEEYREGCIPGLGDTHQDKQWDDICLAMAWISQALLRDKEDIEP